MVFDGTAFCWRTQNATEPECTPLAVAPRHQTSKEKKTRRTSLSLPPPYAQSILKNMSETDMLRTHKSARQECSQHTMVQISQKHTKNFSTYFNIFFIAYSLNPLCYSMSPVPAPSSSSSSSFPSSTWPRIRFCSPLTYKVEIS